MIEWLSDFKTILTTIIAIAGAAGTLYQHFDKQEQHQLNVNQITAIVEAYHKLCK